VKKNLVVAAILLLLAKEVAATDTVRRHLTIIDGARILYAKQLTKVPSANDLWCATIYVQNRSSEKICIAAKHLEDEGGIFVDYAARAWHFIKKFSCDPCHCVYSPAPLWRAPAIGTEQNGMVAWQIMMLKEESCVVCPGDLFTVDLILTESENEKYKSAGIEHLFNITVVRG